MGSTYVSEGRSAFIRRLNEFKRNESAWRMTRTCKPKTEDIKLNTTTACGKEINNVSPVTD